MKAWSRPFNHASTFAMSHSTTESYEQDAQCTYERSTEALSRNRCYHGRARCYIFWVSVCVCVCGHSYPAYKSACDLLSLYCHLRVVRLYQIFPHYLMNGAILGRKKKKKKIEHKTCVLIFSMLLCETLLILWRSDRDMMINVCRCSCKVPACLIRF
jgi:hypothetical protein